MSHLFSSRQVKRKSFERSSSVGRLPHLIELQRQSYASFLQADVEPSDRKDQGLQAAWMSIFPVRDFSGKSQIEFCYYDFEPPKYTEEECLERGLSYASSLRVTFRLIVWDIDGQTGVRSVKDMKEQAVYVGDIPLMTDRGSFVVNGVERVVVSQMHRSPGVFFDHDRGKSHSSGKYLFSARIVPYRGSWIDFEFDAKDVLYVRIDRRRKIPATTLLMALDSQETQEKREAKDLAFYSPDSALDGDVKGMSREEIVRSFYASIPYRRHGNMWIIPFSSERFITRKILFDLKDAKTGDILLSKGAKISPRKAKELNKEGPRDVLIPYDEIFGCYLSSSLYDDQDVLIAHAGQELTKDLMDRLPEDKKQCIECLDIDMARTGPYLCHTLAVDKNMSREDALIDIYRVLRPGEPPTLESAQALFSSIFFNPARYDLSAVGRVKMNGRLGFDVNDTSVRVLTKRDIVVIVRVLLELKDGRETIDDIDNLANRRVRAVGELLENQYRMGLYRMEKSIKERMSAVDVDLAMPNDLINSKPVAVAVKDFFATSQLSQFMDQVNPLTELTHKRRLSALGPGGLTRDRVTFEVRDVHPTHYGRICPIETPDGQNIGLISSLASYARVNMYGFIETPYRKVKDGCISKDVYYMSALEEWKHTIGQASLAVDVRGVVMDDFVPVRKAGDVSVAKSSSVDYVDVSPGQVVSIASSLIPFLENNDAGRALMGSNMQRQAVPLLQPKAPLVGTGIESLVAKDSGVVLKAQHAGVVEQVDSRRILIRVDRTKVADDSDDFLDIYHLRKFKRTNSGTCFSHRPRVRAGDCVEVGDVIADGPATDQGELALGSNALVAFLSWKGYNFKDGVIVSERVVFEDVFTSIYIEEFEIVARDTKLGQEDITRDIPNVGDDLLWGLDESGIVTVGAQVHPGDVLVGKVTPRGESPTTPEAKLLRAIFGEKSSDVTDTSLRVPAGSAGTVIGVRVFSRFGVEKDERTLAIEEEEMLLLKKEKGIQERVVINIFKDRIFLLFLGKKLKSSVGDISKGSVLTQELLDRIFVDKWRHIYVDDRATMDAAEAIKSKVDAMLLSIQSDFESKVSRFCQGFELPPGTLKMVKVFVAIKRKLSVGDKLAGRHGNKGVVSCIVPVENMPYLEDGTPIDIILNPLGLPARMNVGQILETHLGWAASGIGKRIESMVQKVTRSDASDDDWTMLRERLSELYESKEVKQDLVNLDKNDLLHMGKKLSKGLPMATPVFNGAKVDDVARMLDLAGLDHSGQQVLFDGYTGEPFDRPVTVGMKYVLKLNHLVDDKIHARSIGPYSLVTQQPLGGKAQGGGQRFGEMEVWALEAYGASYTLQEILTFKSDDIAGRMNVYSSIVRGDENFQAGVPESFNVLTKELQALALNICFKKNTIE